MAFNATILRDGFLGLQSSPPADEATAKQRMAQILVDYFKTAAAGATPITGSAVDAQQSAIEASLAGMKTTGPTAIQTAIIAFWTVVVTNPAPFFTGHATPAVISPSLSTIAAAMLAAAAATIAAQSPPATACQNLANAIQTGHITTPTTITLTSGPTVVPIT